MNEHINSLHDLGRSEFSIRTIDEAGRLASLLAQACPNVNRTALGISELLINAVEHGNLGLSYDEKSQLKREGRWKSEIDRLSNLPAHRDKRVQVSFERKMEGITLRIVDEGSGFPWRNFLELAPERACDPNGRGIALARMMSFSSVCYEGCGNIAVATIANQVNLG